MRNLSRHDFLAATATSAALPLANKLSDGVPKIPRRRLGRASMPSIGTDKPGQGFPRQFKK